MSKHPVIAGGNTRRYDGIDEVRTPPALFREVDREFGITLDVAADSLRHTVPTFFTPAHDGLSRRWAPNTCWLNPPYSDIAPWLEKSVLEARRGATVVALLPVRTSVGWFHDLVLPYAEIRFIRGRVHFPEHDTTAPFDSMLCIYHPSTD